MLQFASDETFELMASPRAQEAGQILTQQMTVRKIHRQALAHYFHAEDAEIIRWMQGFEPIPLAALPALRDFLHFDDAQYKKLQSLCLYSPAVSMDLDYHAEDAGQLIEYFRKQQTMGAGKFAERLPGNIAKTAVRRWENGYPPMPGNLLPALKEILALNTLDYQLLLHTRFPSLDHEWLEDPALPVNMRGGLMLDAYCQLAGMRHEDVAKHLHVSQDAVVRLKLGKRPIEGEILESVIALFRDCDAKAPKDARWFDEDGFRKACASWDREKHFVTVPPEAKQAGKILRRIHVEKNTTSEKMAASMGCSKRTGNPIQVSCYNQWEREEITADPSVLPHMKEHLPLTDAEYQELLLGCLPAFSKSWLDTQPTMNRAGLVLAAHRDFRGMKQKDAAETLGMTIKSYQLLEGGETEISPQTMQKAMVAFGMTGDQRRYFLQARLPALDTEWLARHKPKKALGLLIAANRFVLGKMQKEMATETGVSKQDLNDWELAVRRPPKETFDTIANYFKSENEKLDKHERVYDAKRLRQLYKYCQRSEKEKPFSIDVESVQNGATAHAGRGAAAPLHSLLKGDTGRVKGSP